jgi:transposase
MTRQEKEKRRIRGVQMVLDGKSHSNTAKELKVTQGAVSQWIKMYNENGWNGLNMRKMTGPKLKFTEEHSKSLFDIICKSPLNWNYESDLWTVSMARDILYQETKSYFSETRVLSELHNLGFSFQKPEIRAYEKKSIRR